jgi:hypothetical protein
MSRVIGECWSPKASRDGHAEIFISPLLDDATGPHGVGATLVHELVHATVGNECGHRGAFKRVAEAVGLEGPMTATHAGGRLRELLGILLLGCGPYPHGRIVDRGMRVPEPEGPRKPGRPKTPEPEDRPADRPPKQGTRNLKVTCPTCGYVCRVTRKWLDIGAPICPTDRESMVEAGQQRTERPGARGRAFPQGEYRCSTKSGKTVPCSATRAEGPPSGAGSGFIRARRAGRRRRSRRAIGRRATNATGAPTVRKGAGSHGGLEETAGVG